MPELQPWHLTHLIQPEYNRVDLVKEGANSQAKIKLFKFKGGTEMKTFEELLKTLKPEHATIITDVIKAKDEAVAAADKKATDAEKKAKDAEEIFAKAKPSAEMTQEEILKSVQDPAVKIFLEQQITKAKIAEEEVRKARESALSIEAISKAAEVPNLGAGQTALVDVYKKLKATDAALADEVFGIFKAASALVTEGGVFTEVGKTAANAVAGDEDSSWALIETKAAEIAKSLNITKPAAITKVMEDHPEMYAAYLKGQRGY